MRGSGLRLRCAAQAGRLGEADQVVILLAPPQHQIPLGDQVVDTEDPGHLGLASVVDVGTTLFDGCPRLALRSDQAGFGQEVDQEQPTTHEFGPGPVRRGRLGEHIEETMAIAIDGEIHQDAYGLQLPPDSEIFLIPKIGGG